MKLTWLGHGGFRIEMAKAVLLVDPWLRNNPLFDNDHFDEAIEGATHILVTHAHADHAEDVAEIARKLKIPVVGIIEYAAWIGETEGVETVPFNMGGTVDCDGVAVTMVRALHSSSYPVNGLPHYLGTEAGFMLQADGSTLYYMGDTDVHSDMPILQDLHAPDHAILPTGGHFTMDSRRAAYACKKFFNFKTVVPCHFGTFPMLEQNADAFVAAMAGTARVVVPEVMVPFEL